MIRSFVLLERLGVLDKAKVGEEAATDGGAQ
jgi:hypothetical protein